MNFTWRMSETEWQRMMDEYKNHKENGNNVYGECFIGGVYCDFVNTMDKNDWYLFTNLFYIKDNSNYGTLDDGTGYDLYNFGSPCIPTECVSFDEFKQKFETAFETFINEHNDLKALINVKTNW